MISKAYRSDSNVDDVEWNLKSQWKSCQSNGHKERGNGLGGESAKIVKVSSDSTSCCLTSPAHFSVSAAVCHSSSLSFSNASLSSLQRRGDMGGYLWLWELPQHMPVPATSEGASTKGEHIIVWLASGSSSATQSKLPSPFARVRGLKTMVKGVSGGSCSKSKALALLTLALWSFDKQCCRAANDRERPCQNFVVQFNALFSCCDRFPWDQLLETLMTHDKHLLAEKQRRWAYDYFESSGLR